MKTINLRFRHFISILAIFVLCTSFLAAQETEPKKADDFEFSAQLAMAEANYMVTAGDVYQLIFNANATAVNYTMIVDTSYKIRVSNLAVLDVRGKTYPALKKQVEEIVMKNYPLSGVQFVLTKPAVFYVTVQGEVTRTTQVRSWGLSRLSSVLSNILTDYSSTRKILVTSSDGKKRTYDLFQATRFGKLSENPYVRPGDVVTIGRRERKVTISGQVERPGTYELLKGENLKTLLNYYGGGVTELADTSRITLVRNRGSEDKGGNLTYLSQKEIDSDYVLNNGDVITISSMSDLLPSIIVEGIIEVRDTDNDEEGVKQGRPTDTSYSVSVKFHKGENYATFVRRTTGLYTQYSDLENSYIERKGKRIVLNIRELLDEADLKSEYNVESGDKLIIPYRQYLSKIMIDGEVTSVVEENAWPLRRLSTIISGNLTSYSSTRNVMVTSIDGTVKTYDLFKASRFGDVEQNPYILAGEKITVGRMERKVTISGQVERPGTYELVAEDNLKNLVEYYGGGLTELADTTRITLVRNRNGEDVAGNLTYLSQTDIDSDLNLNNGDSITISSLSDLLPSVIVEGIVEVRDTDNEEEGVKQSRPTDTAYSVSVKFHKGENYATFVRRTKGLYTQYSDLENSYIERSGKKIALNIREFLDKADLMSDYDVESGDRIIVPYRQYLSKIMIDGEVTSVVEENAWPLRRLSAIISGNLTQYSSTRNVQVTSIDGTVRTYDLFKASRFGEIEQNPYILSGEKITVGRIKRRVAINGEVERPGTYELLEGENIKSLINYYGNGFTEFADPSRIEISRLIDENNNNNNIGRLLYITEKDIESDYKLFLYDTVHVPSLRELKPVAFIEGAIYASEGTSLEASSRKEVRITEGMNYGTFARNNKGLFGATSDLENAYIIRGGKHIPINLFTYLYDVTFYSDLNVEPYDTLMIPFRQYFVTVSGAVYKPGRYPYIPDRTYDYYIGLAGGVIRSQNTGDAVEIRDLDGRKLRKKEVITPECNIEAKTNSFGYFFNQYASVATTLLSIISSVLTVVALVNR
ncbi:MAG: SLBB domain-containing protein [Treponema sp.]|nr:SLBB domain-containing protein [Treponema sp.]